MIRTLTDAEERVLTAMIDHADSFDESVITDAQRSRWRDQVARTRVGGVCGCGCCPTVDLVDEAGSTPTGPRVVLSASHPTGGILLFVDGDRLSRLELYPLDDGIVVSEFPPPLDITY